jgi:predicted dehydrogenase
LGSHDRIRVGLIGVGDVAERDYLPEWHRLAEWAEISVVCGRTPDRARQVAENYGLARWSTDYLEVVRSDIDAVVNLTPINTHYDVTLAALEAGRHVYSEKPLASTPHEARSLQDAARARGLVLACAPSIALFPQVARVRSLVSAGRLGTVRAARAQALAGVPPWPGYGSDPTPYFEALAGPLVDVAVYPLHALTSILGPVSDVTAMALRSRDHFLVGDGRHKGKSVAVEGDDTWQVLARLDGCIASIEANFSTVGSAAADCELRGDRGAVAFSLFDVSAPVALMTEAREWSEVPVAYERKTGGPDHVLGVEHFLRCISEGTAPVLSAERAIHVLEVIEAARESARTGRTAVLEPSQLGPFPPGEDRRGAP